MEQVRVSAAHNGSNDTPDIVATVQTEWMSFWSLLITVETKTIIPTITINVNNDSEVRNSWKKD